VLLHVPYSSKVLLYSEDTILLILYTEQANYHIVVIGKSL
jgi:hypothetical protein